MITRVQWLLLRHLYHKPGRTIGQLAIHLDVRQSTMSQMLDRLEDHINGEAVQSSPQKGREKISA